MGATLDKFEFRDRATQYTTSDIERKVSVEDFPFTILGPSPPFAWGKTIALVVGREDAERIVRLLNLTAEVSEKIKEGVMSEIAGEMWEDYWEEYDRWLEAHDLHDAEEPPQDELVGYDDEGDAILALDKHPPHFMYDELVGYDNQGKEILVR